MKEFILFSCFTFLLTIANAADYQVMQAEQDALWTRAKILYDKGKEAQVIDTLQTLYQRFKTEKNVARQIAVQTVLAKFHRLRTRDFVQANNILKIAERERQNNIAATHLIWQNFYLEWGFLMETWGVRSGKKQLYSEAIKHYKNVLEINKKQDLDLVRPLKLIGRVYQRSNELKKALTYYQKTLGLVKFPDSEWIKIKNNLAQLYLELGQKEKALLMHKEVLDARIKGKGVNTDIAISYINITEALFDMNRLDEAIACLDSFYVHYLFINNIKINAMDTQAKIYQKKYKQNANPLDLKTAINTYIDALKMADSLRTRYLAEETDLDLAKIVNDFIENALWLAAEDENPEFALAFIEKSRSLQLLDNLRKIQADFALPKEFQLGERQWVEKIVQAASLYENGQAIYLDSLIHYRHEQLKFIKKLEQNHPKYYQLKYDTKTIKIAEIQEKLDDSEAFIEYFLGNEYWFAVVIQKNDKQVFRFENSKQLVDSIHLFIDQAATKDSLSTLPSLDKFSRLGHHLYQQLVQALFVDNQISGKLIIAPHSILETFPFDALVSKLSNKGQWPPNFLLHNHQVSLAYSATVLYHENPRKNNAKKGFLGIAPINFKSLASLFSSEEELKTIKNTLGFGDLLLGNSASKQILLRSAKDYQIVHVSSHAFSTPNPHIILYGVDSLFLREIYGLNLNADIVVLSSCESALGKWQPGEGVMSLARGFSYAGSASTVTTLWSVDENAMMQLMKDFYTFIKEGKTKGEALRLAKLAYLDNTSFASKTIPYFWAAPIYFGRDGIVELGDLFIWNRWIYAVGVICLIFVVFGIAKTKK